MNNVWVRPYVARVKNLNGNWVPSDEAKLLLEWLYASRQLNRFDPALFETDRDGNFVRCAVWTCFNEDGIVGFIPVTITYLLESMAFKPGLSPIVEGRALQAMQHHLVFEANKQKISDAFFITIDTEVVEFAKRYGWKLADVPVLNLHFKDLESKNGRTEPTEQG